MEKFNSSLFSRKYHGYSLEKEICSINNRIIENDIYALDFLREANFTYNKDKEYFYTLYKKLEKSNNCGIYIILTAILLKHNDQKANIKIADKKIDILMHKIYDSYYAKYNIEEHIGTPNSLTIINDDIIYEDDERYKLIERFKAKKSAYGYFCASKPYEPYKLKKKPTRNDIIFIRKSLLTNYRIYYILLLSEYSKKSKKLLDIIIKTKSYKSLIYLILSRKEGFNLTYKESLDYFNSFGIALSDIIISYIFFYSYNDSISYYDSFAVQIKNKDFNNFFYSIIKNNQEYFENIFASKTFINDITKNSKNFVPFLNQLYSSDIHFNSSKILCSLLDNKSNIIKKTAIKIINRKKREAFCGVGPGGRTAAQRSFLQGHGSPRKNRPPFTTRTFRSQAAPAKRRDAGHLRETRNQRANRSGTSVARLPKTRHQLPGSFATYDPTGMAAAVIPKPARTPVRRQT